MENYGLAIETAESAIAKDPTYAKGYLRLASSHEILQHYKLAYNAYKKAFELTGNKD